MARPMVWRGGADRPGPRLVRPGEKPLSEDARRLQELFLEYGGHFECEISPAHVRALHLLLAKMFPEGIDTIRLGKALCEIEGKPFS